MRMIRWLFKEPAGTIVIADSVVKRPSDYPELPNFLVKEGINSISLNLTRNEDYSQILDMEDAQSHKTTPPS